MVRKVVFDHKDVAGNHLIVNSNSSDRSSTMFFWPSFMTVAKVRKMVPIKREVNRSTHG